MQIEMTGEFVRQSADVSHGAGNLEGLIALGFESILNKPFLNAVRGADSGLGVSLGSCDHGCDCDAGDCCNCNCFV